MRDHVGQHLGNYQLTRLLGQGGFAEVYLGEHLHLGTLAAIKVLHTQLTTHDSKQFRTEARLIARLVHPHIVRVLDFGIEGETPFLIMEYASHGTLRQRYPKGSRVALETVVSSIKQIAHALHYAHDQRLIHRDVKPENILIGARDELLLSDFGIALVAQSSHYQNTHEVAGTMAYCAPEQIQGKPRPASDQYALGIMVYEWLCGDLPFHGSLTELVGQHLTVLPPPLRQKMPTISVEVEQVVMTALAKDYQQRFGSIEAFARALEQASQATQQFAEARGEETVLSLPPSTTTPSTKKEATPLPPTLQTADGVVSHQKLASALPSSPQKQHRTSPQHKHRYVAPALLLLILVLIVAGSLGIYTTITGTTHTPPTHTSQNSTAWTPQTSGTSYQLWGATWSGSQFVIVGADDTILTSSP